MKKELPELSIIMPIYNRERYVTETIHSILNQTFNNFELIVVDDGSTDNTYDIILTLASKDSRIKIFKVNHSGEVFARNFALTKVNAHSKYIMNHDSDDISLPTKFEKLVNFLESHPEIAIVGCFAEYIDENGILLGRSPYLEWETEKIFETFGKINSVINSCGLIRKEVFDKIGFFREELRSVDDYDFYARALMYGFKISNIPEVLHYVRLHRNTISNLRKEEQEKKANLVQKYYTDFLIKNNIFSKKNLKILLTVEFYYPHVGGSEIVVQKVAEGLNSLGHNVEVATKFLPERNFSELNGIKIHQFDIEGKLPIGIRGKDIRNYLSFLMNSDYDVVFHYSAQQWATDLSFFTLGQTFLKRVNVLAAVGFSALKSAYQLRWLNFSKYFEELIPRYFPFYDAVIYHSRAYQDYLFAKAQRFTNSVVIPNGIDKDEFQKNTPDFRKKYDINSKFLLLCVSNFLPTKRQDLLIEVFKKLGRNDVTLVLISKWGDEKFQKIIHTLAWGLNNVRILENIPREDTVSAFKSADLFVFASEIEAFPLVLLEAQISKTPFVSTDCGNSKELSGGIVCEINEFPKVINQLLDNESLRIELAQKGYDETIKFYTWEKVIEKYNKLFIELYYKKLVKNKQSYLKNIVQPKLGNIEESFLMYLRRNPFDLSIRLELAKRYINIGEIDSAKNLLYSIISIDCKNYEANKLLEEINLKTYEEDTYANI